MAKKLTRTVFVDGVAYGPASAIPADIAARITNPKVWADAEASASAPAGDGSDGAKAAAASGADVPVPDAEATVKELRDYAKAKGITLGSAKAKPEILAVLGLDGDDQEPEDAGAAEESDSTDGADVPEADSAEDGDESTDADADGESVGDDSE